MSVVRKLTAGPETLLQSAQFAARLLRVGQVVALPTDTVYGLAVSARNAVAVERVYAIKRRQARKPLAISVADVSDVHRYLDTDGIPPGVLDELLPGPVTLLLRLRREYVGLHPDSAAFQRLQGWDRIKALAHNLNSATDAADDGGGGDDGGRPAGAMVLGVRVPDSEFVRAVSRELGDPLALTSANLSGAGDCGSVDEFGPLWRHCAAVFDGGALPKPVLASTVVDLSRNNDDGGGSSGGDSGRQRYRIVRSGWTVDHVRQVLHAHNLVDERDEYDR